MTTHQQLTGSSDDDSVKRYAGSHSARFTDAYWAAFEKHVQPLLPPQPTVVDLGCGPALFLQDLSQRVAGARVHGYDVTPAMIEYARTLDMGGASGTFEVADLVNDPIPMADDSADLASMTQVLHLFTDPFVLMNEVRRVLKPSGVFMLYDFVRTSFAEYINRPDQSPPITEVARRRFMDLYPYHNRYSVDDWTWIFGESGFEVVAVETPREKFNRLFVAVPKGSK